MKSFQYPVEAHKSAYKNIFSPFVFSTDDLCVAEIEDINFDKWLAFIGIFENSEDFLCYDVH